MTQALVIAQWAETRSATDLFYQLPPQPGRFLLESQGGPADITHYSFLGHQPFAQLSCHGQHITWIENGSQQEWTGDPLIALQEQLDRFLVTFSPDLPPFQGGAVGYLGYDLGRQLERLPNTAHDDLHLPDLCFSFYDHVLVLDHLNSQATLLALPFPGRETPSIASAKQLHTYIHAAIPPASPPANANHLPTPNPQLPASNFTRASYRAAVERALDHIARGHIYQVNLAQRFNVPLTLSPDLLYRTLRTGNPAPFAAFLHYADFQIISASPERFLQFDPATRRVETRPIKGTRPRGATPAADSQLAQDLLDSEKDKAELVMIVDLERNDLGRVCDYGSVRVTDLRRLEPYPTVWHTVATVEGRLRGNVSNTGLIRAAFPGGSITGAPKIRALKIIEESEGLRRHVYCGAIGYLSFTGHLDLNIAIRTITIKDGRAYFHAGGGIVADSDPDHEYDETLHKARALAKALNADLTDI
jgi:para-aminobenzoate synthetase component 1